MKHHHRGLYLLSFLAIVIVGAASVAAAQSKKASPHPAHEAVAVRAPQPKPIDYDKLTQEATDLLSKYIQINTTNPPGNEAVAAQFLKEKFLADGIPATTWEPLPGRGAVAARLHGIGKHHKALLLLSHMDVVPADPKDWKTPPFAGAVKDGVIWGRGAIDDKGPAVVFLMSMLAVKRAGILLDRDIVFVATGDEEAGGKNGAGWFVDHQPSVYDDVGYVLNEGGGIRILPNDKVYYSVSVTEKTPLWFRITASGQTGHAASPPPETSVTRLLRGLQRLIEYRSPLHLIGPVEDYYHAMAELGYGPKQWIDLSAALKDPAFQKQFLSEPDRNAQVRDTMTPTVLGASSAVNVLPATAYAEVDCRLLPGSDSKTVLKTIDKVLNDKDLKVDVVRNWPPVSSPQKSELMNAIQSLSRHSDKDAPVVPTMTIGFTDSHYFRAKNIIAYGFVPIEIKHPEEAKGIHGNDERISVDELGGGIQRMVELLKISWRPVTKNPKTRIRYGTVTPISAPLPQLSGREVDMAFTRKPRHVISLLCDEVGRSSMIRAGVGFSDALNPRSAAVEATTAAMKQAGLSQAEGALCFATTAYGAAFTMILRAVGTEAKTQQVAGCSSLGVIACETEVESGHGLTVIVFGGQDLTAQGFFAPTLRGRGSEVAAEIANAVRPALRQTNLLCLFADTYNMDAEKLLPALARELPNVVITGGGASEDGSVGETFVFYGDAVSNNAASGMLISGDFDLTIASSLACAPVGPAHRVTEVRDNVILRLNGRPAYEVFCEAAGPLAADLRRALAFVFLAVPMDPTADKIERGKFLVRNIVGGSEENGALAVAHTPKVGDTVGLVLRDAERARTNLKETLEDVKGQLAGRTAFGLYFDCVSRGSGLYIPGHDSAYIRQYLGEIPVGGFFTGFEIGPTGDQTSLLQYSGVLAFVSDRTIKH